jgi:hypothetical protein
VGVLNGDPTDSLPLVAREMLQRLRRRADRNVANALFIGIDLTAGYKPAKVRGRYSLTQDDYKLGYRWWREELDILRDEEQALA